MSTETITIVQWKSGRGQGIVGMGTQSVYYMKDDPKNQSYILEGRPRVVQASPTSECSRNPSVSVHQLLLL